MIPVLLFLAACTGAGPANPTGDSGAGGSDDGAPSSATIAVSPAWPADDEALTCTVLVPSVDPDGDTVSYRFAWSVDGTDAGITGDTVDPARTSEGQRWTCAVTPSDGRRDGPTSTAVATIGPAPGAPSAPVVAVAPASPMDDEGLACTIATASIDPDGDTVSYRYAWTVDGADAGLTDWRVSSDRTEAGQNWTCTVVATDGTFESLAASDSVVVLEACAGTPPSVTELAIEDGGLHEFEGSLLPTLFVQATASDADGDLHRMNLSVWWDDRVDGVVDTSDVGEELGYVEMSSEECSVETASYGVYFAVDGDRFDPATDYEFAVVVYDAHGLASAPAIGGGTTPSVE